MADLFTDDELVDLRCRVLMGERLDEDTSLRLIDQLRDAEDRVLCTRSNVVLEEAFDAG